MVLGLLMGRLFDVQRSLRLQFLHKKSEQLVENARWTQDLQCSSCGHKFVESVRRTSQGYLKKEGEPRTCPSCGNATQGFEGGRLVEANKEAARLSSVERRISRLIKPG